MKRSLVVVIVAAALACTESNAPPGHNPGAFSILPARDTVAAGVSVTFVAEREDSSVDAWEVSDSSAARIEEQQRGWARVMTLAAGTVTIKATSQGDTGQAILVILPPPPPPPDSVPPPPPPPPSGPFAIRPAIDTAYLNDPPNDRVWFVAERADSTVDRWTVSDSSIVHLFPSERGQALVQAFRPGTVTITAWRGGDSGQATLVIPPFTIWPILDTIKVGEQVTFGGNHFHFPYDLIEWSLSDSARARVTQQDKNWATVLAQAAGTVTITATHRGDTARATLVIREPQPGEWESIDLGVLDGRGGAAIAIGDDGSVVGSLGSGPDFFLSGFIYKDGAMRRLPTSGLSEQPVARSPSGRIVGITYVGGSSERHVVIWDTPDAAPRLLDEPMGILTVDINDPGDVLITTMNWRSVLWRNSVRVELGDLGDSTVQVPETYATALNDRGQIVGWSRVTQANPSCPTSACGTHPFLWENGVMRDLGGLAPHPCTNVATSADCSWSEATDINNSGVVVGFSPNAEGQFRAFIWENGVMRDLGVAPGQTTNALAINDRGQVMGTIGYGGCTTFLWENGQTQIIGPICPTGLSPNGEVIGWAAGRDGAHAFMWQAGRLIDLGLGEPRAINAHGEVAGVSCRDCLARPKLWRKKL